MKTLYNLVSVVHNAPFCPAKLQKQKKKVETINSLFFTNKTLSLYYLSQIIQQASIRYFAVP